MNAELVKACHQYHRACDQFEALADILEELATRYALLDDRQLRRQIAIRKMTIRALLFDVINYLRLKKSHILDLRLKLYGENPFSRDSFMGGFDEEIDELEDHEEEEEEDDYDDSDEGFDEEIDELEDHEEEEEEEEEDDYDDSDESEYGETEEEDDDDLRTD